MPWLISLIVGWGVPARFAKPLLIGVGVLLLLLAIFAAVKLHDRRVIDTHAAKQELKQVKRERQADTNLEQQKGRDETASQQRQQEMTNATRDIPDRAPSARQRSIACVELRREAKSAGKPQPAC